jgi:hypothetical protein
MQPIGLPFATTLPAGAVGAPSSDGAITFSPSWFEILAPSLLSLAILVFGAAILAGRVHWITGKRTLLGLLLSTIGAVFLAATLLVVPFNRVTITPNELQIANGILGIGSARTLNLDGWQSIERTKERRRRRRHHATEVVVVARFHATSRDRQILVVRGPMLEASLPVMLERAQQLGAEVIDRRSEFKE